MFNIARKCLLTMISASITLIMAPAQATDWLSLQGTEPAGSSARARVWGFIQPQFAYIDDTRVKAGPWQGQKSIFNVIRPDNKSNSGFLIRRARLGVRGTGFPLDSNVNYFLLAEFGNNGITRSSGGSVKVTDASITLNHLKKFTRFRFGQFKTPGSEDGLQAIHVHNYNNFSLAAGQLVLERFRDTDGVAPCNAAATPEYLALCSGGNGLNGSVGAYRDIGAQLFNTFTLNDLAGKYPWELSYAFMVGNGNGIARGDNDGEREFYYYLSAGQVFEGAGPRRQDWKLFAWYQDGEREIFDSTANAKEDFDRTRWGVGATLRWKKYRLFGEYISADGMIPNGSDGGAVPGSVNNAGTVTSTANVLTDNEADGWYIDVGYKVLPNLELDVRYDRLDRGTKGAASNEREFTRWTLGAQYFFNKKSRFTLNYEFRDIDAPGGNATAKSVVSGIEDVLTAQVLIIF